MMRRIAQVLLAAAATSIAGAGVAQAFWGTTGSGSGTATSGSMSIAAEALSGESAADRLYPGGTAEAILKVRNPNAFPVQVVAITATGTPQAGNGCTPAGVTFAPPASPAFTLPAQQATVLHLPGAMAMDVTSASACQGQTFSLLVTVTVQR